MHAGSRVLRSLRRSPGFVAIATLSMGAALGLSTSVFAVMDAMTHPEPPFRDVGQLYNVWMWAQAREMPSQGEMARAVAALEWVERISSARYILESMAVGDFVNRTELVSAASGYFDVLGVRPRLGRLFAPGEYAGGENVAVVSDMIWRRNFANRSAIGDATVTFRDRSFRVVGVLPSGTDRSIRADVFVPDTARVLTTSGLIIRLKPGVSDAQFAARLRDLNQRWTKAYAGPKDRGFRGTIHSLRPDPLMIRDFHRAMVGAAICILIIACANVAALMLARGMARRRDYALQLALGARPREIARDVIAEIGVLTLVGCVAGAFVASWVVGAIGGAMPPEMEWQGFVQPQWSWRVLAMALVGVVVSIAVAGGFPAWMAARTDPAGPLKEGAGGTTGRAGTRFRWLVMAELAIAMTLLMSTSLMLKSIRLMEAYEFGYPHDRLYRVGIGAPWREDSTSVEEMVRTRQQALALLRSVPGVESAILGSEGRCGTRYTGDNVIVSDRTAEGGPSIDLRAAGVRPGGCAWVAPAFMTTIGLRVVDGRDFADGDASAGARGAVILDERTAGRLFPNERAVGRLVKFGDLASTAPWVPVVGVVANHMLGFDSHPELGPNTSPTIYFAGPRLERRGSRNMAFTFRAAVNVEDITVRVTRAMYAFAPPRGGVGVQAWDMNYQQQLRTEQFLSLVFTMMGLASLLLGAAGLYSVISYVAGQRMREFAVRIALGATKENVVKLVLRDAFTMAIGGTAVGAGFGMWAAFLLWERMWGIYPVDAEALVIAEVTLVLVTMAACLGPALRAARSDPLEIIRAA